jgi:hypothetical protein
MNLFNASGFDSRGSHRAELESAMLHKKIRLVYRSDNV